jgi:hypothetical protein
MGNVASPEATVGARAVSVPRGAWSDAEDRAICGALEATRKSGGGVVVVESGTGLKLSISVPSEGVKTSPAADGASAYRAAATVAVLTVLAALVIQAGAGAASGGGMLETLFSPGVENVVGWWHWKLMEAVWSSLLILLVPHLHDDVRQALADIRHALCL